MNAKKELLEHIKGSESPIKCVYINDNNTFRTSKINITLKVNYNDKEYFDFLKSLDFEYDSSFGGEFLYGTIWYQDGSWSERRGYDEPEWWEYKSTPEIPKELLKI